MATHAWTKLYTEMMIVYPELMVFTPLEGIFSFFTMHESKLSADFLQSIESEEEIRK